jgi:hypothetical protein
MKRYVEDRLADALLTQVSLEFMQSLRDYKRQWVRCWERAVSKGLCWEDFSSVENLFKVYSTVKGDFQEEIKVLLHILQNARDQVNLDSEDFSFLVIWFLKGGDTSKVWWKNYETKILLRRRKQRKFLSLLKNFATS